MSTSLTFSPPPLPAAPTATALAAEEITQLLSAGREVKACMRALERVGLNLVGEVLKDQGDFVEMEHYPHADVFDDESHSQYYYHAHRSEHPEHGHFHTFVRAAAMPDTVQPIDCPTATQPWPRGEQAIAHLVGISMDAYGRPIGLFAANRWVTGESFYRADDTIKLLPSFRVDHAWPSWPVNRWITAMLILFRPQIQLLLRHRDRVIDAWQQHHPNRDIFEERDLELTGYLPISVDAWTAELERAVG